MSDYPDIAPFLGIAMGMHYKCLTHTSNLFYLWQNLRNEGLMVCLLYSNINITKEIASKKWLSYALYTYGDIKNTLSEMNT